MKRSLILSILAIAFLSSGCTSTNLNITKNDVKKYDSSMTSKQVEEKMGWTYCEESN